MKISYKHLTENMLDKPSIEDISNKLFQLGHEHDITDEIFDIEFTPNRGDCLSVHGLQRDLNQFFQIPEPRDIYEDEIPSFNFDFINTAENSCTKITFLKIEIDKKPSFYLDYLDNYFSELSVKKNNFFTDVSNYVSYETGQPTHCYELSKINQPITLNFLKNNYSFQTLLDKEIEIQKDNLVFTDKNNKVINLAGIVGGADTACKKETTSVLVECAYFDPEAIIGNSVKYGINSDAAYKFERNVDINSHEYVVRRFLKIIQDHSNIESVEIYQKSFEDPQKKLIPFDLNGINKILGTSIDEDVCVRYLENFGFKVTDNFITVPSYRNDVISKNDIAEEIARAIGYDNINTEDFSISIDRDLKVNRDEQNLKKHLIENGFYEVINDPFVSEGNNKSIVVDNPLDSNRKFLRSNLKNSLLKNLSFNERRQKDSIKLFEISDVYSLESDSIKKVIGIIASGRVGKNYKEFSNKIDKKYLESLLLNALNLKEFNILEVSRESIDSKIKSPIIYTEIEIDQSALINFSENEKLRKKVDSFKYIPISDFPSSVRDLSFSLKDYSKCKVLEKLMLEYKHKILKEIFVFDYYKNEKLNEIKIGFRIVFQSKRETITEQKVNSVMENIISDALAIDSSINIPGL